MVTPAVELVAPSLLISMPALAEPHFNHAVVLVLKHSEEGTMGLVLNKPSPLPMGTFCESQQMPYRGDPSTAVYHGGPVQTDRAFLLHVSEHNGPETEDVQGELKFSYSMESLQQLAKDAPPRFRVYLGYAGWEGDQLASELLTGTWLLSQLHPDLIFDTPYAHIWERALQRQGISPMQLMHTAAQTRRN